MPDATAVRRDWIMSRCRAMYCKAPWTWTDEYGNDWCEHHGAGDQVCQRYGCDMVADRRDGWCEDHTRRQRLTDLAVTRGCPLLSLPDGRVIAPGLPTYNAVAKRYGERDYCLVFGVLLASEERGR